MTNETGSILLNDLTDAEKLALDTGQTTLEEIASAREQAMQNPQPQGLGERTLEF